MSVMSAKEIIVITGANTGIGYEAVKALLQSSNYHIFLGSRSLDKGNEAIAQLAKDVPEAQSTVELLHIDVTDDESIGKAFALVQSKVIKVDALINNAGAQFESVFCNDASDFRTIFNKTWDVNATGPQVVTYKFAPLLLASPSPRLIFLTSGMSTLQGHANTFMPQDLPNPAGGWPKDSLRSGQAYRSSKAGLNMLMLSWHWILKEDGVRTFCVSPGFLATNLSGTPERMKKAGAGDPSRGGDLIKKVIQGERDADAGKVVFQDGIVQDW